MDFEAYKLLLSVEFTRKEITYSIALMIAVILEIFIVSIGNTGVARRHPIYWMISALAGLAFIVFLGISYAIV